MILLPSLDVIHSQTSPLVVFTEALRILQECHGEELRHPLVSQTLIHIGAVYYRERNSVEGATKHSDGCGIIEAGMLEVIGRAHEDRGSYKMAISFFEEKLQYLNKNRGDPKSADDIAELEDIAATLNSLGMLCCRAGIFMSGKMLLDDRMESTLMFHFQHMLLYF